MENFKEVAIPQALFHRLEQIGFVKPTPIQAQSIPVALEGRDILGTAQTGTGKTAAFGIPLVTQLMNNSRGTALILLPTRELAMQVTKSLAQFIGSSKIKTALLIGGEDMNKQFRQLQAQPRLIVGTPGRINDHLARGSLKLHDTDFLVLDEVDRMLDMGFGIQLEAIARYLTVKKRQTLMFSATLPKNIEPIAAKYLTDPVRISVGATHKPAANVTQDNIKLSEGEKYVELLNQIKARTGSIIIFVKTKRAADNMSTKLRKINLKADALHGDLRQSRRNRVIEEYRKQNFNILVATDVAARGLDIPHIEHVINYDLPQNPEDYIHRIGRTARAGAEGEALNFITPADSIKWRAIEILLNPELKHTDNGHNPARKRNRSGRRPDRRPANQNPEFKYKENNRNSGGRRSSETSDRKPFYNNSENMQKENGRDNAGRRHKPETSERKPFYNNSENTHKENNRNNAGRRHKPETSDRRPANNNPENKYKENGRNSDGRWQKPKTSDKRFEKQKPSDSFSGKKKSGKLSWFSKKRKPAAA